MSKLTLTIAPEVIKQAKQYAAEQQQSLSKLIENYLKSLPQPSKTQKPKKAPVLQGVVAELAGIIDEQDLKEASGHSYVDHLQEKYQ